MGHIVITPLERMSAEVLGPIYERILQGAQCAPMR